MAIEKDDLSLLAGMSAKERQKLRSKGIFTVTQLSYTFRPRRRPKRLRDKREKYHHSLKALAIREKKIHIVGSPELKIEGTPVYLDVEGLPDRDFYYLIGVRIGHGESAVQHSLWADTVEDEGKIWREFLAILETVEKPVLIHYGSYETTFLKRMCERYGAPPERFRSRHRDHLRRKPSVRDARADLLPDPFQQAQRCRSTSGLHLVPADASGRQSIVGVIVGDDPRTDLETHLTLYNREDCEGLARVAETLGALGPPALGPGSSDKNVVAVESQVRQTMWPRFSSPIAAFEQINKAARWDYQRKRVYVRTSPRIRRTTACKGACKKAASKAQSHRRSEHPGVRPASSKPFDDLNQDKDPPRPPFW